MDISERKLTLDATLKSIDAALDSPQNLFLSSFKNNESQNDSLTCIYDATAPAPPLSTKNPDLDETQATILSQDDPGVKASQLLFSEFVNIMVSHPTDILIWEEIAAYERICAQQVEFLTKILRKVPRHHVHFSKTETMMLRMKGERNTWRLLGSLYYDRINEAFMENESQLIDTMRDRTDKEIISQLYESSVSIREAQNVIDWLEKNAQDDYEGKYYDNVGYFGNTHVAWESTLRVLKDESRQLRRGGEGRLVTSLDPDAPVRQGKVLHDLDQEEDQRLVHCMFTCIRSGQFSDAQEFCAKSGQHWRASILEGWKLYHDCNKKNSDMRSPISGNNYRDVWKGVAWRASNDEKLAVEERAMYGALCGHLPAMLKICVNWEDQLWAHFRTLVDQRVEETLRGYSLHLRTLHPLPQDYPEERLTFEGIFKSIESRLEIHSQNSYHILQKYLILNDIKGLLNTTHCWIKKGSVSPHFLRCLTHLLLVLRRLGRIPYDLQELMTDILHACVKEAMERGDVEQVARYSSVLPEELQVRCYADFLININDEHHRKHALGLASMVGLFTPAITATVVMKIRLEPGSDISNVIIAETTSDDKVKISALDWLLYDKAQRPEALRQANSLLRHFLISRKMAAAKSLFQKIPVDSIDVIIKLHESKSRSSELPYYYENRIREYLCYKTFLDAQESFTDWFDHYHQKKPSEPKKPKTSCTFQEQLAYDHALQQYNTEYDRWKHTLDLIAKKACERLYNVLLFPDGGWLVDLTPLPGDLQENVAENEAGEQMEQEGDQAFWGTTNKGQRSLDMCEADKEFLQYIEPEIAMREPNRSHQLIILRSIYIPQFTSLLQNILHCSGDYKECIQLADLIASEKHGLYKCFCVGEMQRFLFKLQETSKELLDMNYDALGYPLH